jgi:tRNA threonylcarbamoyladenosine biosynthesis protein TsaB
MLKVYRMRVLALDTTSRAGSVALVVDDRVVDERAGDSSRSHGERLPAELEQLGAAWSTVDVFAVASGPGSFTGLRIGIATIQGLALVTGRPVASVSALEALAQMASQDVDAGSLVASWIDAQRGEVFSALYRVTDAPAFTPERLLELEVPAVANPVSTLAAWSAYDLPSVTFAGDGAVRYAPAVGSGGFALQTGMPVKLARPALLAGAIGRMAAVSASRGLTVSPAAVHPLYVRRPDVELHREQTRTC